MRGDDMTERERKIRQRAEQLWEQAGKPVGRDEEIWLEAELQVEIEERDKRPDPPPARGGGSGRS